MIDEHTRMIKDVFLSLWQSLDDVLSIEIDSFIQKVFAIQIHPPPSCDDDLLSQLTSKHTTVTISQENINRDLTLFFNIQIIKVVVNSRVVIGK